MVIAIIPLVLGVVVGLLRGGTLDSISAARFRQPWLVFAGLAVQVVAQFLAHPVPQLHSGAAGPVALGVSYALIIAFVVLNYRFPGTVWIGLGLALNLVVIGANGAMPVSLAAVRHAGARSLPGLQTGVKHHVMGRVTRLRFLGDIVPVPQLGVVSVGDLVLSLGVFLLVQRLVAGPRTTEGAPETAADGPTEHEGGPGRSDELPTGPPESPQAVADPPDTSRR